MPMVTTLGRFQNQKYMQNILLTTKVLKGDLDKYLDADEDIIKCLTKIDYIPVDVGLSRCHYQNYLK